MVASDSLSPFLPSSPAEYDQRRRLQAARNIAWAIGGILVVFIGFLTVYIARQPLAVEQRALAIALDLVLVACIGLFAVGGYAGMRGIAGVAEGATILAINVGLITFDFMWAFPLKQGLDPILLVAFGVAGVVIGITGALGQPWMVMLTTLIMNMLTVTLGTLAPIMPSSQQVITPERGLIIPLALLEQWAMAAIILTMGFIYQHTVADVTRAYNQARALDDAKDQFITHVNHELRTPSMAVTGYIAYLLPILPRIQSGQMPQNTLEECLHNAAQAGDRLLGLLNTILDVRRIDTGAEFDSEMVPVQASVDAALQVLDPREVHAASRSIHVTIPADLAIWGEPIRFQQILTNLLANALKYSPPDAAVEVTATIVSEPAPILTGRWRDHAAARTREMVEIAVRDYGLGVPLDQQGLLFHRFVRLPRDLASSVRGTGLGLFTCRTFAEAMGGRIWIESTGIPGEGTTMRVRLPCTAILVSQEAQ